MKKLITIVAVLASVSAFAGLRLESHYGKLTLNGKYSCTLTNNTGSNLDLKWVVFNLERRAGKDNREVVVQKKVDQIVYDGESITVSSGETAALIGQSCKFLAR